MCVCNGDADGEGCQAVGYASLAHCSVYPANPLSTHTYIKLVGESAPIPIHTPFLLCPWLPPHLPFLWRRQGAPLPLVLSCCDGEVHPQLIMYQREDRARERELWPRRMQPLHYLAFTDTFQLISDSIFNIALGEGGHSLILTPTWFSAVSLYFGPMKKEAAYIYIYRQAWAKK